MKIFVSTMMAVMCGLMVGCGQSEEQAAAPAEPLPAGLIVTTAPEGALDVAAAKQSARDGQPIVVKGHVGGQVEPLVANRAIMTIADLSLRTCDQVPGDTCKTPWDSCCEPKDVVAAKSISIQVVHPDGKPIKAGLSGLGGIKPQKQVIVEGVAKQVDQTTVVQARHIYVVP
jgi:hypothetical protein